MTMPDNQNQKRFISLMPDAQGIKNIEQVFRHQVIASELDIHRAQGLIKALTSNDYINWIDLDYMLRALDRIEKRPMDEDGYQLFPTNIDIFLEQLRLFVQQEQDRIQGMHVGLRSLGVEP